MKRYSIEWLCKQPIKQDIKPAPFAGKYPTRIALLVIGKNGTYRYVGNPKINLINNATDHACQVFETAKRYTLVEFDRKNVIYRVERGVTNKNRNLDYYYHPRFINWFYYKFEVKNHYGQRVYQNPEHGWTGGAEYRRWLEVNGLRGAE